MNSLCVALRNGRRMLAGLVMMVAAACAAHAQAESAGAWMEYYAPALGLAPEGLPGHSEWVDEVTATVSDPAHLAALGIAGAARGEKVILTNHDNGYWTIELTASGRKTIVPLAYLVRFGVIPEKDLSAQKVPERISGRVVSPGILAQYEFRTASTAQRFTLAYEEGAWWMTLEPSGERRLVPF